MKAFDVFPGSRRLVKGPFPSASLLLIGPAGVGKTIFCKQFLYNGLITGEPCLYVTTDESPTEIEGSMNSFGFDVEPYVEETVFRVVDCYSWRLGGESSSEYAVDSSHPYLTAVSINIDKARRGLT
jgi:KaiC/GvpD/RAD55 family RecA-like ATPase